jgi:hypothetical protein
MNSKIISLSGFQSSGKDTIADYLVNKYGFVKLSFASILKDIISIIFDWDRNSLEGISKEDREWREKIDEWWSDKLNIPNFTPRYAMQNIGSIFRDHFNKDIWVKCLEKKLSKYNKIVISDCRFENEFNMVKSYNGINICIFRNNPIWYKDYIDSGLSSLRERDYLVKKLNIHESDYKWLEFNYDITINNNGTINELYKKIDDLF